MLNLGMTKLYTAQAFCQAQSFDSSRVDMALGIIEYDDQRKIQANS